MASVVQCPKCQAKFDATGMPGGSTTPCPACGVLTRIPTGTTGQHPAAPAPAAAAPSAGGGRKTKVRHRSGTRVTRRSSNTGAMIGITLGALAFIILVVVIVASQSKPQVVVVQQPPQPQPPPVAPSSPPASQPSQPSSPDTSPPPAPKPPPPANADRADWPKLMRMLRPGGGFDDPERPEGAAFARVQSMGKNAYPHLVKYIGDPDILMARAAVAVLNELSGRNGKLPNEATRDAVKAEWEAWLKDNK